MRSISSAGRVYGEDGSSCTIDTSLMIVSHRFTLSFLVTSTSRMAREDGLLRTLAPALCQS